MGQSSVVPKSHFERRTKQTSIELHTLKGNRHEVRKEKNKKKRGSLRSGLRCNGPNREKAKGNDV